MTMTTATIIPQMNCVLNYTVSVPNNLIEQKVLFFSMLRHLCCTTINYIITGDKNKISFYY